jgi:hypothetical protein
VRCLLPDRKLPALESTSWSGGARRNCAPDRGQACAGCRSTITPVGSGKLARVGAVGTRRPLSRPPALGPPAGNGCLRSVQACRTRGGCPPRATKIDPDRAGDTP